jgi:hypothetical protein
MHQILFMAEKVYLDLASFGEIRLYFDLIVTSILLLQRWRLLSQLTHEREKGDGHFHAS